MPPAAGGGGFGGLGPGRPGSPTPGRQGYRRPQCRTSPPYCGRGPLQLTYKENYEWCDHKGHQYGTSGVSKDLDIVEKDEKVGFGTAACVWDGLLVLWEPFRPPQGPIPATATGDEG